MYNSHIEQRTASRIIINPNLFLTEVKGRVAVFSDQSVPSRMINYM
jgi:hypothetical protein